MKRIIDVPKEVYEALKGITEDATSLDPYSLADLIVNKSKPLDELSPQGEWKDYSDYGFVECPFCHKATTCEDNIDELNFCWNCGAHLRKGEEE